MSEKLKATKRRAEAITVFSPVNLPEYRFCKYPDFRPKKAPSPSVPFKLVKVRVASFAYGLLSFSTDGALNNSAVSDLCKDSEIEFMSIFLGATLLTTNEVRSLFEKNEPHVNGLGRYPCCVNSFRG